MGAGSSSRSEGSGDCAYKRSQQEYAKMLHNYGVTGGCDCNYFGGDEEKATDASKELREYESSLAARAKEQTIRRLARALMRAGVQVDPEGDLDVITAELVKALPNPKNGKTFKSAAAAQEKVCRVVADVLNDEFSPGKTRPAEKFIDTSLSSVEVCRMVGEWAHSFSMGVNTEFLAVMASVKNSMRNIEVLDEVMANSMNKIRERIAKTNDAEQNRDLQVLEDLYSRAAAEQKRALQVLKNMLHIQLPPAAESLEIALRDQSEQSALVKKLKLQPGTAEFSASLASAISGLGTAASVAQRVNKALKAAGLSAREYVESADFKELQRKLDARVESGKIEAKDLADFLRSIDVLRAAFGERENKQFKEALEVTGGGMRAENGMRADNVRGGADDEKKSDVQKRLEKSKVENEIIIKDFARRLARHYDEFLSSVKAIGPRLGKDIPLTDHTDKLRDAFDRIRESGDDNRRIEFALIGRYVDAEARQLKEKFLLRMHSISDACEELLALEMYRPAAAYFNRVREAVTSIEKTIEYYSDVFTKKSGVSAIEDTRAITDISPEIAASSLSLKEAVTEFVYLYYVARIRVNLSRTSAELETYGEKYVDLLGDAVAQRIKSLDAEQLGIKTYLSAAAAPAAGWPAAIAAPDQRKDAQKWVDEEFAAKKQFYKALQALDLYMKAFTEAIAKDPDAIHDIKKILDGTQVIARWFNESTGDSVWQAFENCPSIDAATGAIVAHGAEAAAIGAHYYDKVGSGAGLVGIPELGQDINKPDVKAAKKKVGDAYENFQALKNLVNAFARIGDQFGGRELRTAVFMSPTQIYKALMDYLRMSAMSINHQDSVLAVGGVQQLVAAASVPDVVPAVAPWQVYFNSVAHMPAAPVAGGSTRGNYAVEDRFFSLIIKAMAAKVLTVIGVYDMFERTAPLYELTPVRMIVGGDDETPAALDGAAELYYRLPRLAEFYYGLFNWKNDPAAEKITLVPDFDGVFGGLIRFIFLRTVSQETGDYSDSEVRILVREVNAVYQRFSESSPESAISSALAAFVKEINRRYGIVKKEEYDTFRNSLKRNLATVQNNLVARNETNFAILPGEGDVEADRRAPSDYRYYGEAGPAAPVVDFTGRPQLDLTGTNGQQMLDDFRKKLDDYFKGAQADFGSESQSDLIKQARIEISRAQSADAKLGVAAKLIRGDATAGDAMKQLMFHETVVVGIDSLNALHMMLKSFDEAVRLMDPHKLEADIMTALNTAAAALPASAFLLPNDANSMHSRSGLSANVTDTNAYAFGALAQALPPVLTQADLEMEGNLQAGPQQDKLVALRLAARLLTDYPKIMKEFVERLFAISGSGLVEVHIGAAGIRINFQNLQSAIESILADVKGFLGQLRQHISKQTVDDYQAKIQTLEKDLIDKYFRGEIMQDPDAPVGDETAEGLSRFVSKLFNRLTRKKRVSFKGIDQAALAVPAAAIAAAQQDNEGAYEWYYSALAGIAYYDGFLADSGVVAAAGAIDQEGLDGLISTDRAGARLQINAAPARRLALYDGDMKALSQRSLLLAYNQLVAQYLMSLMDSAAGKHIYLNLINAFATGVSSPAVNMPNKNAHIDLVAAGTFGQRGDPQPNAVLLQSLAIVFQRLLKDVNPSNQVSDHLVSTLTDVPLYVKESMRANLPSFIRLFDMIVQKGDFLKQIVQKTQIHMDRAALGAAGFIAGYAAANVVAVPSAQNFFDMGVALSNDAGRTRMSSIIDGIANGAVVLSNAGSEVLKELGDSPVYLQDGENAIEQYRMRNGKMPLMPLSLSMYYLRDNVAAAAAPALDDSRTPIGIVFPHQTMGTVGFKFLYGTRGLVAQKGAIGFDQMPDVKVLLDQYNGLAVARERFDAPRFLKFSQSVIGALRYATDFRCFKGMISPMDALRDLQFVSESYAARPATSLEDVIQIVESSDQEDSMQKMVKGISVAASTFATGDASQEAIQARKQSQIRNIIDMNIIPINVHALMRGIPLANLYNYSYTFEQFACQMFGELDIQNAPSNAKQMFLKLLKDPYMEVTAAQYGSDITDTGSAGFVHRIFRGDNGLGMGRPKFLSDQLFNKALFGSVYQSRHDWDEAGPMVGIGASRGRGAATGPVASAWNVLEQTKAEIAAMQVEFAIKIVAADEAAIKAAVQTSFAVPGFGNESIQQRIARFHTRFSVAAGALPARKAAMEAIRDLLKAGPAAAAHNLADLAAAVKAAGAGAVVAAAGPLAAEFNPATANSVAALIGNQIAAPGDWAAGLRAEAAEYQRRPGAVPVEAAIPRAAGQQRPQFGGRAATLTWVSAADGEREQADAIHKVRLGTDNPVELKQRLEAIGRLRFDTTMVRNMFFITNVTRLIRLKLSRELSHSRSVLRSSHMAVAAEVTEYGTDPYGPNSVYDSRTVTGRSAWASNDKL